MKVSCFKEQGGTLQLEERARPVPGPGELLLRVHACGICHGDVSLRYGAFPFARFPIVPGHEIAGVVEQIGEGVEGFRLGDHVGLSVLFNSCGQCGACKAGAENLCPTWTWTGMMVDGGYAEYVIAKAAYVAPLPPGLAFSHAAPLMCAGVTVYAGLRLARCRPGDRVAVIALGGLGHLGVLYARALGARVAVVSSTKSKEREALELGAERFIHMNSGEAASALQRWEGGADIILATAPNVESINAALAGLAPEGRAVVLGVGPGKIEVDPVALVMGQRQLMGSPAGSRRELRETLELAAKHSIRPRIETYPLERAAEAFAAVESGKFAGRIVLVNEA
ncbi:MAG TPA: alcohol dehydrogenase catalytic domain-containing protein [Patescibacteria group bacterium]|nr:alcohol dehydrogenase catalytic domain-containing protein [Patescibacteria group bacterium]